ncbi:MAG: GHMP kinase [Flavobacteriaceae bacterium]|nr:GHMP kinase [Flavobacteriaceae bacterium]
MEQQKYYSNGKLLLTAEYLVLNKAFALALPTKYGQSMEVDSRVMTKDDKYNLNWKSYNSEDNLWLDISINTDSWKYSNNNNSKPEIVVKLVEILKTCQVIEINCFDTSIRQNIVTRTSFPQDWGLGSSSTLINNIASWLSLNPYLLNIKCFGGSCYDIACAITNNPIIYRKYDDKYEVEDYNFSPKFKDMIFFVHLNKKQNSRDSINKYNQNEDPKQSIYKRVSSISYELLDVETLQEFEELLTQHEALISEATGLTTVTELLFADYSKGICKSLGAWGGDFILVTGKPEDMSYFKDKGYNTIIPFSDMIL